MAKRSQKKIVKFDLLTTKEIVMVEIACVVRRHQKYQGKVIANIC